MKYVLLYLGAVLLACGYVMLEARLVRRHRIRRSVLDALAWYDEQGRCDRRGA